MVNDRPSTRTPPGSILEIDGLRKTFAATGEDQVPVRALRHFDLRVDDGEFVALMGPSGCGKSTVLNLIAGLDTPTDGVIRIGGEPISGSSEAVQLKLVRQLAERDPNMLDRLGALGGTLRVESAPGRGTKITGVVTGAAGGSSTA